MKILYLHGLEETKSSPKPLLLKSEPDFDVYFAELNIAPTKRNGFIKQAILNKRLWINVALAGSVSLLGVSSIISFGLLGCSLYFQRKQFIAEIVIGAVGDTYQVAIDALKISKPDIIIGFSWGGALAAMLLKSGRWKGPTILLAPAYELLMSKCDAKGKDSVKILSDKFNYREKFDEQLKSLVKVVVGSNDQIISPSSVEEFAARNEFEITIIPGAVHKLWKFQDLAEFTRAFLSSIQT